MKKELPKMYHSQINKNINNVQCTYSSINKGKNNNNDRALNTNYTLYDIETKITNIFNSPSFVYKADVNILTDSGLSKKRIIGKKNGYLITMDNELIPIGTIKDIYI